MKILINEQLSPHKYKTSEGYLVCVDSVLARTGKQTYTRDEVFNDGEDIEVEVDRTEDEVFSPETLASFENKPLTLTHPDEDVTVENHREYSMGFVRDVHKGIDNGQPVMLGTLVVTDKEAIEGIESGKYKDLSCGYDCDIDDTDHPCQRNIRGNHVALCEQGRAGNARVVDSMKDKTDNLPNILFKQSDFNEDDSYEYWKEEWKTGLDYDKKGNIKALKSWANKNMQYVDDFKDKNMQRHIRSVLHLMTLREDSIKDVEPRAGEKKEDFIERFMEETKSEYPDIKQRYAVANSYWKRKDSVEDEESERMPAQLKKELKQHFGRISTYIPKSSRNKDVADFLKEWERWFRIDGKPISFNRESIKGWYKTNDGMMRKDYVFTVNDYTDRFMLSVYSEPETYELTEMNAYFIDSVKDKVIHKGNGEVHFFYRRNGKEVDVDAWNVHNLNQQEVDKISKKYNVRISHHGDYCIIFSTSNNIENVCRAFNAINPHYSVSDLLKMNMSDSVNDIDPYAKVTGSLEEDAEVIEGIGDSMKDALVDSTMTDLDKFDAIRKIKAILNNSANIHEDSEGLKYLTQNSYREISNIAHAAKLNRKDMEEIDWVLFGPGGYYTIADANPYAKVTGSLEKEVNQMNDSHKLDKVLKIVKILNK